MPKWVSAWQERLTGLWDEALAYPRIGRAYGAYQRYEYTGMQHVAGSVTYFGVLTLFPMLALLFALVAKLIAGNPGLRAQVNQTLQQGLGVSADLGAEVFTAQAQASIQAILGTLGVTGVLYAGRLWVDAYRRALRVVWAEESVRRVSTVWRYVRDVLVLLAIAAAMAVMVGFALFATGGPYRVFALNGHAWPTWAAVLVRVAAVVACAVWGAFICGALYHRLGRAPRDPFVRRASLLAGVALAGCVIGGLVLLKHAFADPAYGIVVAMLGLMLWVSMVVRITLALAVWAAGPTKPS